MHGFPKMVLHQNTFFNVAIFYLFERATEREGDFPSGGSFAKCLQ